MASKIIPFFFLNSLFHGSRLFDPGEYESSNVVSEWWKDGLRWFFHELWPLLQR